MVRAAVVPAMDDEKIQYLAAFLLLERSDGLTNLKWSMQSKRALAAYLSAIVLGLMERSIKGYGLYHGLPMCLNEAKK